MIKYTFYCEHCIHYDIETKNCLLYGEITTDNYAMLARCMREKDRKI